MRTLFAILLAALFVPVVAFARPRPPAPVDTMSWRTLGYREPWTSMAMQRRFGAMDSLALSRQTLMIERGERDSLTVAVTLLDLIEIGCLNGRAREPQVLAQLQRATAICEQYSGPDSLLLGRALRAASELHRRRREPEVAESNVSRAMGIFERALPADHIEVGAVLRQAALVASSAQRGHRLAEAKRALGIMVRRFGPDDPRTLSAYSALAAQQNIAGDQVNSLINLEHTLRLLEASLGADHSDVDQTRYNVALVSMRVGDLVRARGLLERNIAWESSRARVDSLRLGHSVSGYMECLNDLGDHEEVLAVHQRWSAVVERAFAVGDPSRYDQLHEQAIAYAGVGRGAEAVALFDSTIAFEAKFNDSLGAVPVLFERAGALRIAGDSAATMQAIELAGAMALRAGERVTSLYEPWLLWARCLNDANRPSEAVTRLDAALEQATTLLGPSSASQAQLLAEKARALTQLGDARAFDIALEAATLQADLLRTAARGFPDRQALVYARNAGLGLDPLLVLAAGGKLNAAQRAATLGRVMDARSLVLDEVGRRQGALRRAGDARARALLDSLGRSRGVLARRLVSPESSADQDSLRRDARADSERLERALADLGLLTPESAPAQPLASLAAGDVLISYMEYLAPAGGARTERRQLAFVSRTGAAPEVVALGRASDLDVLVARWREDVTRSGAEGERRSRASGARLRARVWDPIAAHAAGASRIVIVPDGALHLVDFAALPDARGGYLVERVPVMMRLGAERDLAAMGRGAGEGAGSLLALGGADFESAGPLSSGAGATTRGGAVACARFADVRFAALPGAAAEAESLTAHWRARGGKTSLLSGGSASEREFCAAAPHFSTLHIATHGFFVGGECAVSAPASRGIGGLAAADASNASTATPGANNALRLSGLALAGANRRAQASGEDDGILTAEEISALDLSRVREVVLSACDTGLGDIAAGEGVLGLQRAFRLAGARSLVMSLWPVDDRATREWMDAYYGSRLGGGAGVAASVRAADLSRLRELRKAGRPTPPSAWAGFVSLGD